MIPICEVIFSWITLRLVASNMLSSYCCDLGQPLMLEHMKEVILKPLSRSSLKHSFLGRTARDAPTRIARRLIFSVTTEDTLCMLSLLTALEHHLSAVSIMFLWRS